MQPALESRGENAVGVSKDSHDLTGVDWHSDISKRRRNISAGSMPNVLNSEAGKPEPSANPFSRTASSAEDDVVGALRTRVMNANFVRRRSETALSSMHLRREIRRTSMPSLSRTMPTSMMKKVWPSCVKKKHINLFHDIGITGHRRELCDIRSCTKGHGRSCRRGRHT